MEYFPCPRNIFLFPGILSFFQEYFPFSRNIFLFPRNNFLVQGIFIVLFPGSFSQEYFLPGIFSFCGALFKLFGKLKGEGHVGKGMVIGGRVMGEGVPLMGAGGRGGWVGRGT